MLENTFRKLVNLCRLCQRPLSSASPAPAPKPRRGFLESLESRQLRSATIQETYPGYYEIDGTPGNDVIYVSVSQNDSTLSFDGNTYTDVSGVTILTGDGDDQIYVQSTDGDGPLSAAIDAGGGDNTVALNFAGSITTGDGADTITLEDSYRGEVFTNGGNDNITVSGNCIDAVIHAGDGDDTVDASNNATGITLYGGAGNDTLIGSAYTDYLYGEDGDDHLYGNAGSDVIYGGSGTDYASGGDGNDTFYLGTGWTADGGAGNDTVHTSDPNGSATDIETITT